MTVQLMNKRAVKRAINKGEQQLNLKKERNCLVLGIFNRTALYNH